MNDLVVVPGTYRWDYLADGSELDGSGGVSRLGFADDDLVLFGRFGGRPRATFRYRSMEALKYDKQRLRNACLHITFTNGAVLTLMERRGSRLDGVVLARLRSATGTW